MSCVLASVIIHVHLRAVLFIIRLQINFILHRICRSYELKAIRNVCFKRLEYVLGVQYSTYPNTVVLKLLYVYKSPRPTLSNIVATIHVAMEYLIVEVRCTVSIKYTPDFKEYKKRNVKYLNNILVTLK